MGLAPLFIALFLGPIVAGGIIAGLLQSSLRETTGVFDRWLHQPEAQQQAMLNALHDAPLDPNTSNRDDSPLPPGGDHDGDTITNADELDIGYDPRNPDSNGDGIDDRVEVAHGVVITKEISGLRGPKLVNGERIYEHQQDWEIGDEGDEFSFEINAKWINLKNQPTTLIFEDQHGPGCNGAVWFVPPPPGELGGGCMPMTFLGGSYTFNDTQVELEDWPTRLEFPVTQTGKYELSIHIKSVVDICVGSGINKAFIYKSTDPERAEDQVRITVLPPEPELQINRLTKTVNGKHLIDAAIDEPLNFHINTQFSFKTCTEPRTVVIKDDYTRGLATKAGIIGWVAHNIRSMGGTGWPLARIPSDLEFVLKESGVYNVDIDFTAHVTQEGITTNKATAFEKDHTWNILTDLVGILVGPNAVGPAVADFDKLGRLHKNGVLGPWSKYIFAHNDDLVEFQIKAEVTGNDYSLVDSLPPGLIYSPNTLKLLFNDKDTNTPEFLLHSVFTKDGIPLDKGPGTYILEFFAKVNAGEPFSLTNTSVVKQGEAVLSEAEAIVYSR